MKSMPGDTASQQFHIMLYLGTQKNTNSRRPEEKYELRKEGCADMISMCRRMKQGKHVEHWWILDMGLYRGRHRLRRRAQHWSYIDEWLSVGSSICRVLNYRLSDLLNRCILRYATHIYTHPSLPTPMASKFFPLRVLLSWRTGTASKFINFSDGGGEPSTQPFQPFFTAARFFRGCGGADTTERLWC